MTCFEIVSSDDMKNKVLRIIREALASDDLIREIEDAFQTSLAKEILEADFYTEDEYEGRHH